MNCFLITVPDDSTLPEESVQNSFESRTLKIREGVWAVAGDYQTCADVCEALQIGSKFETDYSAIVTKLSEYNGFASRTIWQKLSAWEAED